MLIHFRRLKCLVVAVLVSAVICGPASADRLMNVWNQDAVTGEIELIGDPNFKSGFSVIPACEDPEGDKTCSNAERYKIKNPAAPEMSDVKPVWELAQWVSRSNLTGAARPVGKGFGWATDDKRLVVYPDGTVEMAVNGESEFRGRYRRKMPAWPHLLLSQTMAAPGDYSRKVGSIDSLRSLQFNLDFRVVHQAQNAKKGYDPNKHALIFPLNFTIQNLNTSSAGYGEFIWLNISLYDDRKPQQMSGKDFSMVDEGTRKLIYQIPHSALAHHSTNDGAWVRFNGDILPYAKRAVAIAVEKGLVKSDRLSDYSVGGMNIGYELTGLNVGTFQFRNLSLKASIK